MRSAMDDPFREPPLVIPLERCAPASEVGGKAANLARLIAAGVLVPRGFVVTAAALRSFLEANGLEPLIRAVCGDLAAKTAIGVRCAAETIASMFANEPMPADVAIAVRQGWRSLSSSAVIVRSSAAGEDSENASFAGQLESIADVIDEGRLLQALRSVWASRWGHRALAYQAARGAPLAGMGVVVQEQVTASLSGVLFTVAPGSASHMLVEYCGGMGEALVSGTMTPGRLTIERATSRWSRDRSPDVPTPAESLLLDDRCIARIAALGRRIEKIFGAPQDIEWTLDGTGRIWIVQARPITSIAKDPHVGAEARAREVLWSNANVNENFPQPISPLLYSIASAGYYHYFRNLGKSFGISRRRLAAMERPLQHIIGVHGARMYYNLTSIHEVLRSAPFGELLAASFNQFTGASELAPRDPDRSFAARTVSRLRLGAELVTIAARTVWQYAFLTRRVARFERNVSAYADRTRPEALADRPLQDLLEDLSGFLDIRCNRWNDAALADAASMVCYGVLQRLLSRAFPDEDGQALHNSLLKGLPELVSGKPAVALWHLSREIRADAALAQLFAGASVDVLVNLGRDPRFQTFNGRFARYLDEWGFRCSAELMLTTPGFQENPAPVVDLLKAYAASDGPSPADQLTLQRKERLDQTARVRRELRSHRLIPGIPFLSLSPIVSVVLGWTQKSIQLRERARLKQALLYSRLRRVARAIGARLVEDGRLDRQDDVFMLTCDEIDAVGSGHAMFPDHLGQLVMLRREAHAQVSAMSPPDSMRLRPGEYLAAAPSSTAAAPAADATVSLAGVGACGGTKTGRAAILGDVSQSDRLVHGDVLVTRQTDPGWGPIFPLISGLVVERGGMLSHGAIIAREFGIPSVVGVKDATRLITHGAIITVDGDRGVVRLNPGGAAC